MRLCLNTQEITEKTSIYNKVIARLENYVLAELDNGGDIIIIIKMVNDNKSQCEIDIEPKELTTKK